VFLGKKTRTGTLETSLFLFSAKVSIVVLLLGLLGCRGLNINRQVDIELLFVKCIFNVFIALVIDLLFRVRVASVDYRDHLKGVSGDATRRVQLSCREI